jgi:hypothetical protein
VLVEKAWRKNGDIKIDEDDMKAILMINVFNPTKDNIEEVVVHELVHLRLWKLDIIIEQLIKCVFGEYETDPKFEFAHTQYMISAESICENLTKSFLSLKGENKEVSFGRIMNEVKKELQEN